MADSTFDAELVHTVSILRRNNSGTPDEWGVIPESVVTVSTTTICLIQQMDETIEFERRGKKIQTKLCGFFKPTENIVEDDIIIFNTRKYSVLSVEDAGGQGHHLEIYLYSLEN